MCDGDEDGIHTSNRRQEEHISGRNKEDDGNFGSCASELSTTSTRYSEEKRHGLGAFEESTSNRYFKNKKRRMVVS